MHHVVALSLVAFVVVVAVVVLLYLVKTGKIGGKFVKTDGMICGHVDGTAPVDGEVDNLGTLGISECESKCLKSDTCKGFDLYNLVKNAKGELEGSCALHKYELKPKSDDDYCKNKDCGCWVRK